MLPVLKPLQIKVILIVWIILIILIKSRHVAQARNTNNVVVNFLFVKVGVQSKGIGQMIWKELEKLYSNTEVWETCTPYFDKRNINFYVNRLKFHIVEYFNEKHPDSNRPLDCYEEEDGMFKFDKVMK